MGSRKFFISMVTVLFLVVALPGYAQTTSGQYLGSVSAVNNTNPYGISEGTTPVYWSTSYAGNPQSAFVDATSFIVTLLGQSSTLVLSMGPNDIFATLHFNSSGNLDGIKFNSGSYPDAYGACSISMNSPMWVTEVPSNIIGTGDNYPNWSVSGNLTFVESEVPIPGAVWLLGTGLFGLVGLRRKIRKAR